MKKILKLLIIVFAVLVVLIQFYRPERFTTAEVTGNHITKKLNIPPMWKKFSSGPALTATQTIQRGLGTAM